MSIPSDSPSLLFSPPSYSPSSSPHSSASGSEIPTPTAGSPPPSSFRLSSSSSFSDTHTHPRHEQTHRTPSPLDVLVAVSLKMDLPISGSSSPTSTTTTTKIETVVLPPNEQPSTSSSSYPGLTTSFFPPPPPPLPLSTTYPQEELSYRSESTTGEEVVLPSRASSGSEEARRIDWKATSTTGSGEDELAAEELTSKGKKRKRLAKACSACHKSKRRCSGEERCSNCEFSGRECIYVTSKGEPVPAPRGSRPRSDSNLSVASSSARSPTDSLSNSFGSTSLLPSRKPTAFSMGASTLGEGFYGGPKPRQSFGSSSSAMMGIRESEESTSSSWTSRPSAIAPASRFPSTNLPSPPIPSSYPSPHLSKHPLSNPTTEPLDPLLKRSLIHLFFQNLSDPLCSIFHRPTFFASVYENQTSSLLLNAIYAWSARFSDHEAFDASKGERSQRGEPFAEEVRRVVERRGWKEETISRSLGATDEEEMETAQALVLMVMYETLTRRGARTEFYLDILVPFITRLTSQDNPPPPPSRHSPPSLADITARETRSRIFWLTFVLSTFHDAQTGRTGSSAGFTAQDCRLALPVEDGRFEMGACGEGLGADTLTHHHNASKALVSELGHLARVARVFRDVVASSNPSPIPTSPSRNQEAALKAWATGLPPSLQFDETNLSGAVEKIFGRNEDSTGGPSPGGERGHGFATIHTTAEVCMFFHISSVRNAGLTDPAHDEFLISRQSQAVENITFVLSAIGEKGRRNPFMFFPLLIVSQWRNSSSSSSDPRLAAWSSEALALWGISSSSDPSSNLSPLISSPSGLSSDFSPFSLRSPTLLGNSPSSPASSLRNGSSSTRLPSISSLTGGRDRSNSNLSTSHPPIYSVPALPSGARAHRSDSTSSLGGASFPSFGATGSPVTLPIPVPSGSPSWLYTGGMGSGAGYFEGMSPRSWDQGLTGRRSAGDEEEQRR